MAIRLSNICLFSTLILALAFESCREKGCTDPSAINYDPKAERDDRSCNYGEKYESEKHEIMENHANIAYALYTDALIEAIAFDTAVHQFVKDPSGDGLSAAQLAWRNAHFAYMRCYVLRFSNGPIDDERHLDRLIDAWPIREEFVDQTPKGFSGIVNDPSLIKKLSKDSLVAINEHYDGGYISTGFHVLEYLLWSFDTADVAQATPGLREYYEFIPSYPGTKNATRRAAMLRICADLLVDHLTILQNEWSEVGIENYRTDFLALDVNEALRNILMGIGTLAKSELADRALLLPLNQVNPDLEMSPFSDNTSIELGYAVEGIEIVYNGIYESKNVASLVAGKSIHELIVTMDSGLEELVQETLDDARSSADTIPSPFDWYITQEAVKGNGPVRETADHLMKLEDLMYEVADRNGFGLVTKLPN
ncbi:MAG: imelysin family protein [Flavobacteriales bacterium]